MSTGQNLPNLGKYRILDTLGQGRFATVYKAEDTTMNRHVAIKVFDPALLQDGAWVNRLRDKLQTVARLQYPHIIPIFDIGETEDQLYVVMQLARDGSLAQAIATHNAQYVPWNKALNFLKPICQALDYAHGQSIVHSDLKPANILIDPPGGPLLVDFGLTRLMADNSVGLSRIEGGVIGTLAYIAPEVWETEPAEIPADIYALGCIAGEMLLGRKLFDDTGVMQAMHAHAQGPQLPETWPSGIPEGIADVLRRAMAWDPSARYPNAMAFWNALKGLESKIGAAAGAKLAAVAEQLRLKAESALKTGKLQAAKLAVNQWLAMEPDNPSALKARDAIERQIAATQQPTVPPQPQAAPAQPQAAPPQQPAAPVQPQVAAPQPRPAPVQQPAPSPQPAPAPQPVASPPAQPAPAPFTFTTVPGGLVGTLANKQSVEQFIGTEGQLDVYAAEVNGQPWRLTWCFPAQATPEKRATVEALIQQGAPAASFLWPATVVESSAVPGFGYLTPPPDARFKNVEDLAKRWIEPTFHTLASALLGMVDSFTALHLKGLCYHDFSLRDVFFDPDTGDVLLNNAKDVIAGETGGLQNLRYIAPEIVRGEAPPSAQSDLYTLSALLFYIMMVHHPLEGERVTNAPAFDRATELRLFGTDPVFVFDPDNDTNRPVPGYHVGVLDYWPLYPQFIRDLFIQAFTAGLSDPYGGRIRESEWRKALVRLRDAIIYCPQCSAENFYDIEVLKASGGHPGTCWSCDSDLVLPPRLRIGDAVVMLNYNTKLYPHHIDPDKMYDFSAPVAEVAQHPQYPNIWGLKNVGHEKWVITTDDGSIKDVEPAAIVEEILEKTAVPGAQARV